MKVIENQETLAY